MDIALSLPSVPFNCFSTKENRLRWLKYVLDRHPKMKLMLEIHGVPVTEVPVTEDENTNTRPEFFNSLS